MRADDFFGQLTEANPEIRAVAADVDPPFILASNVYRLRTGLGLTQAHLAERIGVRQPRIAEIERGDANPRLDTLARLAAALRVSVSALLAGEDAATGRALTSVRRTAISHRGTETQRRTDGHPATGAAHDRG